MAKSARASSKKNSRSKLRATVTGPEEEARLQRLSAKLFAIASAEKPTVPTSTMDVDEGTKSSTPHAKGVEKKKGPRVKRTRQAMSNKLSTDASKPTAEENSAAKQVKGAMDGAPERDSIKKGQKKIIKHSKGKRRAAVVFPGLKGSNRGKIQRKRK
ncbi:hypothetical protein BGX38DRAFT_831977 [Terfezia claveryi]|nr:hypothetical protein BGX38DRAFT_831977 [Terfezia claveryi]